MTTKQDERLMVWGLATFHTVMFVVVLLGVVHWNDTVGKLLSSLNTISGLVIFCLLWFTTWWSTRKYVGRLGDLLNPATRIEIQELIHKAGSAGLVNGVLFLFAISVVVAVTAGSPVAILFFLPACLLAALLGLLSGILFGLASWVLLKVARNLVLASTSQGSQTGDLPASLAS